MQFEQTNLNAYPQLLDYRTQALNAEAAAKLAQCSGTRFAVTPSSALDAVGRIPLAQQLAK